MNQDVAAKWKAYPKHVQTLLLKLRAMIYVVAKEEQLGEIEESLKWGEPAYRGPHGSTVRIDWKSKTPDEYAFILIVKPGWWRRFGKFIPANFVMSVIERWYYRSTMIFRRRH